MKLDKNNFLTPKYVVPIALVLVFGVFVFFSYKQPKNNLTFHGPHIGPELAQVVQSENPDVELAAAGRFRLERQRRLRDRNDNRSVSGGSTPAPVTTAPAVAPTPTTPTTATVTPKPTPAPVTTVQPASTAQTTTTTSNTTTQTTVSTTPQPIINYSGFGIAAGGGLIYLGQNDLNTYFTSLKALGVTWVRWDIDWSVVQSRDAKTYDWAGVDRVANTAKNYGIKSLGIVTYAPDWAEISGCGSEQHCPPKDPNTFATFAGAVATRYKGVISALEIWNEENYPSFWSPAPNVQEYSNLLKLSYTAIKKVDPMVIVLSGGLAAAADEGGHISPLTFIKGLYASGANGYFDAVALHPYTYPISPEYIASWNSWQQMYLIRGLMVSNNEGDKKIWITEFGTPTNGPSKQRNLNELDFSYGSDYMSEAAQQTMVDRVGTSYNTDKSWMGPFFWYSLKDNSSNKNDPENFFGLIRYDGSFKPAYATFENFISQ